MKLDVVAKNYTPSDKLTEVLQKKLNRLDKYFSDEATARVVMKGEKKCEVLEISISYRGTLLRAEVKDEHIYDCIDRALPKLEKQLVRHRDKFNDKQKDVVAPQFEFAQKEEVESVPEIVKTKTFEVKAEDLKEAVAGLELVDHDFYLFQNIATGHIEAVYRRADGKIGHLIPKV
jgi:putative sigma-54 modulation protein